MITSEALINAAWIIAGVWGAVKLFEIALEHLDTLRWKVADSYHLRISKIVSEKEGLEEQLDEVKKERDMMLAYFFPAKTEVETTGENTPVKRGPGRPRKYRKYQPKN